MCVLQHDLCCLCMRYLFNCPTMFLQGLAAAPEPAAAKPAVAAKPAKPAKK